MSPSASVAASRAAETRAPARRTAVRALRVVAKTAGVVMLALFAAQYCAGVLLVMGLRGEVAHVTPLTFARYAYYYGNRADFRRTLWMSAAGGVGLVGAAALAIWWPKPRALHGDACFASRQEIRCAGLLGERGIILGRLGRRCLMLAGQQGVALAAPPRAGKGTGVVIPNLLNWPDSLICVDIKRENWATTAGFRAAAGQRCYLFDPFAETGATARWNPFFYVAESPTRRINDLQRIAEMLYPDPPNVDPFWTASARSLFLGIALYLFETPSATKTIGEVLRQGMASDDEGFGAHWKRVIEGRNRGRYPLSPECVRALYDVIDLAPVTASSIRKTFTSRLDLWLNPILDHATSGNDFDLRELRRTATSIYVGVNPDDLHRLRPVLSLFFQQAIGLQTRALPEHDATLRLQVLLMLDEFTALGRIPIIAEAVSYLPGYNLRMVLVIQTPAQLREVYGAHAAETMLKSLAARIVFAPKDFNDAKEISDELGFTTVKARTVSRAAFALDAKGRRTPNISVSEQRRALLLPQEVKELGPEAAIIFYEGLRPIRCAKIRYFEDERFRARLLPPPTVSAGPSFAAKSRETPSSGRDPTLIYRPGAGSPVSGGSIEAPPRSAFIQSEDPWIAPPATTRDATMEDIERIQSLRLEDFAGDFSGVLSAQAPGEQSAEAEMRHAADRLIQALARG